MCIGNRSDGDDADKIELDSNKKLFTKLGFCAVAKERQLSSLLIPEINFRSPYPREAFFPSIVGTGSVEPKFQPQILSLLPTLAVTLMTSLLPIIKDILPIIMPSQVHVTKSTELDIATGQTDGMVRKGAIVKKSDKVCASVHLAFCSVWAQSLHSPVLPLGTTTIRFVEELSSV
ncbi:hypothetical protein WAI453_004656 [Rhynchosporium graminicola]